MQDLTEAGLKALIQSEVNTAMGDALGDHVRQALLQKILSRWVLAIHGLLGFSLVTAILWVGSKAGEVQTALDQALLAQNKAMEAQRGAVSAQHDAQEARTQAAEARTEAMRAKYASVEAQEETELKRTSAIRSAEGAKIQHEEATKAAKQARESALSLRTLEESYRLAIKDLGKKWFDEQQSLLTDGATLEAFHTAADQHYADLTTKYKHLRDQCTTIQDDLGKTAKQVSALERQVGPWDPEQSITMTIADHSDELRNAIKFDDTFQMQVTDQEAYKNLKWVRLNSQGNIETSTREESSKWKIQRSIQ